MTPKLPGTLAGGARAHPLGLGELEPTRDIVNGVVGAVLLPRQEGWGVVKYLGEAGLVGGDTLGREGEGQDAIQGWAGGVIV